LLPVLALRFGPFDLLLLPIGLYPGMGRRSVYVLPRGPILNKYTPTVEEYILKAASATETRSITSLLETLKKPAAAVYIAAGL